MQEIIEKRIKVLQRKHTAQRKKLIAQAGKGNIDSVRGICDALEVIDGQMVLLEELLEQLIGGE